MPFRLSVWFALIHRRFKIEIFVPHTMMSVGRDVIQYSETRLSNFGTCNLSEHPPQFQNVSYHGRSIRMLQSRRCVFLLTTIIAMDPSRSLGRKIMLIFPFPRSRAAYESGCVFRRGVLNVPCAYYTASIVHLGSLQSRKAGSHR